MTVSAQDTGRASPVFENGQAQPVEAFSNADQWIRQELWVETGFDSDGDGKPDRMHASVVRQLQTETEGLKVPVIYESSPYYSGTNGSFDYYWDLRHDVGAAPPLRPNPPPIAPRIQPFISDRLVSDWVPRGFAVVHSESPGTGLSEGCPTVGGINEALAPKAVIDWLNGRATGYTTPDGEEEVFAAWSNGKVGMTGTSYNATLSLLAATTGVDGLEAIIPVAPATSWGHYYRQNGLIHSPAGYPGEDLDVAYNIIHSRTDRREYCDATVRDGEIARGQDRITGDFNAFWAGRDYMNVIDHVHAATLMSHGFNDWNVMAEQSNRISQALKARHVPVQIYYHQGGHGGPPPMELMNRWFTRYVYGIENGVENDPRAWIVREGDDPSEPTAYADYPNPAASQVSLYPRAGGIGTGKLLTSAGSFQGTETLEDNFSFPGEALASAEFTNHRLRFLTPVLREPLHLSGTGTITIRAASSKPGVNLSVWLVSLPWTEGRRARGGLINRAWADLQNHESLWESSPLVPGEFYSMTFSFQPDDQIIAAGQQIGLIIFSSDHEFTLRPDPGTELTVDLDATSITLPVVGGQAALARAIDY